MILLSPNPLFIDGGEKEKFEAYRELGTALHTLEDFLAHCKLSLRYRRYQLVFDIHYSFQPTT